MIFCTLPPLLGRDKDEVVVMKNGDRYTCEIVRLSQGQLQIKTDNTTGVVNVDWSKVDRIESTHYYAVELSDGRTLAGVISKAAGANTKRDFRVTTDGASEDVVARDVVGIARSGEKLKGRLSGSISAGFNYAKGNNNVQYNLDGNLIARARTHEFSATASSNFAGQSEGTSTTRNELNLQYWKSFSKNWLWGSYNDFLRSSEQQLNLRSTFGLLVARVVRRSNRTSFILDSGAVYTAERYKPQPGLQPYRNNAEATFGATFSLFRFDSTRISAQSMVFPSITDPGRLRIDTNVNGKIDLTHHVNWTVSLYSNYDNRPPTHVPNSDFGINCGVGWSFP